MEERDLGSEVVAVGGEEGVHAAEGEGVAGVEECAHCFSVLFVSFLLVLYCTVAMEIWIIQVFACRMQKV